MRASVILKAKAKGNKRKSGAGIMVTRIIRPTVMICELFI